MQRTNGIKKESPASHTASGESTSHSTGRRRAACGAGVWVSCHDAAIAGLVQALGRNGAKVCAVMNRVDVDLDNLKPACEVENVDQVAALRLLSSGGALTLQALGAGAAFDQLGAQHLDGLGWLDSGGALGPDQLGPDQVPVTWPRVPSPYSQHGFALNGDGKLWGTWTLAIHHVLQMPPASAAAGGERIALIEAKGRVKSFEVHGTGLHHLVLFVSTPFGFFLLVYWCNG